MTILGVCEQCRVVVQVTEAEMAQAYRRCDGANVMRTCNIQYETPGLEDWISKCGGDVIGLINLGDDHGHS